MIEKEEDTVGMSLVIFGILAFITGRIYEWIRREKSQSQSI